MNSQDKYDQLRRQIIAAANAQKIRIPAKDVPFESRARVRLSHASHDIITDIVLQANMDDDTRYKPTQAVTIAGFPVIRGSALQVAAFEFIPPPPITC